MSALCICIVLRAFVTVLSRCFVCEFSIKNESSYFWVILRGSAVLFIFSSSCVLYSAGSGMKNVHVVLSAFRMRLFV